MQFQAVHHELGDFIKEGLGVDENDIGKNFFVVKDELESVKVFQRCFEGLPCEMML